MDGGELLVGRFPRVNPPAAFEESLGDHVVADRLEPPGILRMLVRRVVQEKTVVVDEAGGRGFRFHVSRFKTSILFLKPET